MAQTFKFEDAPAALAMLTSLHPPGKIALVNDRRGPGLASAASREQQSAWDCGECGQDAGPGACGMQPGVQRQEAVGYGWPIGM